MIVVEGEATPEEIAAITAVISTLSSNDGEMPRQPRTSPWKFANLHPELDIDALRHAQGKPIVL